MRKVRLIFAGLWIAAGTVASYGQGNLVRNGSFEDLRATWVDTTCNYMSLFAGAKTIPGWTVVPGTINEVVWAKTLTCDNHTAANRTFFLDITGFGGDSPNGGVQQTLHNLIPGQQYIFVMDVVTIGTLPLVTVGTTAVALHAGTPIIKGSDTWTPEIGVFVAQSANPVLTIQNQAGGQQINFIDNVVVRPR